MMLEAGLNMTEQWDVSLLFFKSMPVKKELLFIANNKPKNCLPRLGLTEDIRTTDSGYFWH